MGASWARTNTRAQTELQQLPSCTDLLLWCSGPEDPDTEFIELEEEEEEQEQEEEEGEDEKHDEDAEQASLEFDRFAVVLSHGGAFAGVFFFAVQVRQTDWVCLLLCKESDMIF